MCTSLNSAKIMTETTKAKIRAGKNSDIKPCNSKNERRSSEIFDLKLNMEHYSRNRNHFLKKMEEKENTVADLLTEIIVGYVHTQALHNRSKESLESNLKNKQADTAKKQRSVSST